MKTFKTKYTGARKYTYDVGIRYLHHNILLFCSETRGIQTVARGSGNACNEQFK